MKVADEYHLGDKELFEKCFEITKRSSVQTAQTANHESTA
jgi:hypothetical protein